MFLKIILAFSYAITAIYILSILLPALYCYRHGCKGPDLDAFMPAFLFTPGGAITAIFCLIDTVQRIKKKQALWLFWPLAIIFSLVLLGVVVLIALVIFHTVLRR